MISINPPFLNIISLFLMDQVFSFDGEDTALEVPEAVFNHMLHQHFTISAWLRHGAAEASRYHIAVVWPVLIGQKKNSCLFLKFTDRQWKMVPPQDLTKNMFHKNYLWKWLALVFLGVKLQTNSFFYFNYNQRKTRTNITIILLSFLQYFEDLYIKPLR